MYFFALRNIYQFVHALWNTLGSIWARCMIPIKDYSQEKGPPFDIRPSLIMQFEGQCQTRLPQSQVVAVDLWIFEYTYIKSYFGCVVYNVL